jgi:Uma2 family endonuclease
MSRLKFQATAEASKDVARVSRLLHSWSGSQTHRIETQGPLAIRPRSLFEPDIAVLAPADDWYRHRVVEATDARLVIEVSDSTLARDRQIKLPVYARARVPEVWIVNVGAEALEVRTDPVGEEYQELRVYDRSSGPVLTQLERWHVTVADIFD